MSFVNVIPWLFGSLGLCVSGLVCDFLFRETGDALFARKLVLVACPIVAGISVAMKGFVTGIVSAVSLMAIAVFFTYLSGTAYWAIIHDTVQGENVGGASGFVHLIANCAGIIGSAATGFIVHSTGAFTGAFLLAGRLCTMRSHCGGVRIVPFPASILRSTSMSLLVDFARNPPPYRT